MTQIAKEMAIYHERIVVAAKKESNYSNTKETIVLKKDIRIGTIMCCK